MYAKRTCLSVENCWMVMIRANMGKFQASVQRSAMAQQLINHLGLENERSLCLFRNAETNSYCTQWTSWAPWVDLIHECCRVVAMLGILDSLLDNEPMGKGCLICILAPAFLSICKIWSKQRMFKVIERPAAPRQTQFWLLYKHAKTKATELFCWSIAFWHHWWWSSWSKGHLWWRRIPCRSQLMLQWEAHALKSGMAITLTWLVSRLIKWACWHKAWGCFTDRHLNNEKEQSGSMHPLAAVKHQAYQLQAGIYIAIHWRATLTAPKACMLSVVVRICCIVYNALQSDKTHTCTFWW